MKKSFIILSLICVIFILYFYVIEKQLATIKINHYLTTHQIENTQIKSKHIFKDWKMGGYTIKIEFYDDKDCIYYYHYDLFTNKKNEKLKFNTLDLYVVKNGYNLDNTNIKNIEYPFIKN